MDLLETPRLLLRTPHRKDLEDFFEYAQSPEVGPNAGWNPIIYRRNALFVLREFIRKRVTWAIEERHSGKMIGTVSLHPDKRRGHPLAREIGYSLNPNYWGKGYMTETVKAVTAYAFLVLKLEVLSTDHYPFNLRSERVIQKSGFQYEGTIRLAFQAGNGQLYDHVCYSITRLEYFQKGLQNELKGLK